MKTGRSAASPNFGEKPEKENRSSIPKSETERKEAYGEVIFGKNRPAPPLSGNRRMLIKVCGLRETENIRLVSRLDIDWIGFIFYPRSPRYILAPLLQDKQVSEGSAKNPVPDFFISDARTPHSPRRVGVFVNESAEYMAEIAETFGLDYLQLHGRETPDACYALHKRGFALIKAFSIASADDLLQTRAYEGRVDYFLFDTHCAGYGGSGRCFDWRILAGYAGQTPFLLSGGIGPDQLEELRAFRHPCLAGIDLNSAFETAPGRKDTEKLADFIRSYRTIHPA